MEVGGITDAEWVEVRAIPGAQMRGTWGNHLMWLCLLLPSNYRGATRPNPNKAASAADFSSARDDPSVGNTIHKGSVGAASRVMALFLK